ncbi:hypothetical protein GSS88_06015 [Corynebacterium sp. 3HC-13]|uniref:PLDc N-terminal domain-containing protein n=1 Tax=Corynebacterium poyangense TaxID=2684405 RepID=UPI001CC9DE6D|nr:PLDc N-terminal domain-containing protein [Corynebacterium poyangense]MBZ8177353.1 hypothetical protein [Corynebacterium poyangense]
MGASRSPLVPTLWDYMWAFLAALAFLLALIAIVLLVKDRHTTKSTLVSLLLVLGVPIIGPLLYFLYR